MLLLADVLMVPHFVHLELLRHLGPEDAAEELHPPNGAGAGVEKAGSVAGGIERQEDVALRLIDGLPVRGRVRVGRMWRCDLWGKGLASEN